PGWFNDGSYNNVTKVVFDPTFTDARPTTTYSWFNSMTKLQTITGIEYLNTSEVTNMSNMFYCCEALTSIDLSRFNTAKVTDMSCMFMNCETLPSLNLSSFNTAKVTTMYRMFRGCEALTSLDLSSFNTVKVTDMKMMFYYCTHLKTISVSEYWNTTAVKTSNDMFAYCTRLVGGAGTTYDANHVDVSYAHIDGGTSNPGYLTAMIEPKAYVCYSSSNTTLTFYFDNLFTTRTYDDIYELNKGTGIPRWFNDGTYSDVTKVVFDPSFAEARPTSTCAWFVGMSNLQSITGLEYLNTSEVTNMMTMYGECSSLKNLDMSNFNTAKVTDMSSMFNGCTSLTTIYAGNHWSTKKVTSSSFMFNNCTKLVGCKGTKYNANHVDAAYAHIDGGTSNPGYLSASIRGDVNLDGTVDIADAVSVLNVMAGQTVAGDANVNGDFDANGNPVIDIADLVTVLNIMAGQ
ncbi:MAG: BspA family leucine-rich repeat surface protein, partial [Bacteroidaceae bacterium]|nr:BspA family leucine-rich repeat surface protein [Bacteroidaceae bacterium]